MAVDLSAAGADPSEQDWRALRRGLVEHSLRHGEGVDQLGRPLLWLLDCRQVLLRSRYLPPAGRLVWRRVRRHAPDLVGGPTLAADPLTAAVLYEAAGEGLPIGGFTVRREKKPHGLRNLIEGQPVQPGASVVLLDDLISSGRSLLRAHDAVTAAGGTVLAAVVLVDFGGRRVSRFLRLGMTLESVFTLPDLGLVARPPGQPIPTWQVASTSMIVRLRNLTRAR